MRVRQSFCYPCFRPAYMSLDRLCEEAARIGCAVEATVEGLRRVVPYAVRRFGNSFREIFMAGAGQILFVVVLVDLRRRPGTIRGHRQAA